MKNDAASTATPSAPSYRKYLLIWVLLIILLVGGTFISELHISKREIVSLIALVSLIKAGLVALFFMHLKSERSLPLWVVVLFPFFLVGLVGVLLFLGPLFLRY